MARFNVKFCSENYFKTCFGEFYEAVVEKDVEVFKGDYVITPKAHAEQILETKNKKLLENVKVLKVPYYETSNASGSTIYIASEV